MSSESSPLLLLVGGALITAVLCTLLTEDGWIIWIPVLLALGTLGRLGHRSNR